MAKYGSNTVQISFDGDDISAHILSINGVKIMSMFESDSHGFNKAWAETLATGLKRVEPIEIEGFYDDVANAPHEQFKETADGPATATKNIVFTWGGSKTTTIKTLIESYERLPSRGQLTRYKARLVPTGAVTEV